MPFDKVLLVMPSGRHGLGYAMDVIPTGLEYLAAYIEDSVSEVHILDLKMEIKPIEYYLRKFNPDLVGISMCATEHSEGLDIANTAKKMGKTTLVGNYHPTGMPHFFAAHPDIDFVIRGEGERTLLELIKTGHARGVLGVSYKGEKGVVHNPDRPFIEDLDALPFPSRHLRRYTYKTRIGRKIERDSLTFSRGCWGKCTFCCELSMNKSSQRYRSPQNILKEIIEIFDFHGRDSLYIHLTDACALGDAGIVEKLCDLLIPLDLDLEIACHIRADRVIAHPDVISKMVKAGFVSFEMGIESPHPRDLFSTNKGMTADVHEKACRILRGFGAQPLGTFVIGLPEQTEEEILAFPSYGKRIGLSKAAFGIATPFPGTAFFKELDEQGLIFEKDWSKFDEMHSVFHNKHLPEKRVEALSSRCMSRFWTIDTLLDIENLEKIRTGRKKSLFAFGKDMRSLLEMGQKTITKLQKDKTILHILEFLKEAQDDVSVNKMQNLKIHEIIDVDRFLKITGDQTIQVTIDYKNQPQTSWIIKIKNKTVEYVKAIEGETEDASIHFRSDLAFLEKYPNPSSVQTWILLFKFLNSNKGIVRRINLLRLILALILG